MPLKITVPNGEPIHLIGFGTVTIEKLSSNRSSVTFDLPNVKVVRGSLIEKHKRRQLQDTRAVISELRTISLQTEESPPEDKCFNCDGPVVSGHCTECESWHKH